MSNIAFQANPSDVTPRKEAPLILWMRVESLHRTPGKAGCVSDANNCRHLLLICNIRKEVHRLLHICSLSMLYLYAPKRGHMHVPIYLLRKVTGFVGQLRLSFRDVKPPASRVLVPFSQGAQPLG